MLNENKMLLSDLVYGFSTTRTAYAVDPLICHALCEVGVSNMLVAGS